MSESSKVNPLERGPKPRKTTGFGADFVHPVLAAYAAEGNQEEGYDISFYMPEGPHIHPEYKEGGQESKSADISEYMPEGPHVFKDPGVVEDEEHVDC